MRTLRQIFVSGAAGALVVVAQLGATEPLALRPDGIQFPDGTVQTTASIGQQPKSFYLTDAVFRGNVALTACVAGYHMAFVWEIVRTPSFIYASGLPEAFVPTDWDLDPQYSPPAGTWGRVRTGTPSSSTDNCLGWTDEDGGNSGRGAKFTESLGAWELGSLGCGSSWRVWCVED